MSDRQRKKRKRGLGEQGGGAAWEREFSCLPQDFCAFRCAALRWERRWKRPGGLDVEVTPRFRSDSTGVGIVSGPVLQAKEAQLSTCLVQLGLLLSCYGALLHAKAVSSRAGKEKRGSHVHMCIGGCKGCPATSFFSFLFVFLTSIALSDSVPVRDGRPDRPAPHLLLWRCILFMEEGS